MLRFVVQQHFRDAEDWHFDLMLEAGDALVTFSSPVPPDDLASLPCLVHHLGDHRLAYLEKEGEISGSRGWCRIHDQGLLEWLEPADPAGRDLADEVRVRLDGQKARGVYRLAREPASGADYWRLRHVPEGRTGTLADKPPSPGLRSPGPPAAPGGKRP